ncbi:MAG: DUF6807 family protein [Bacteroidota bacterium]
MNYKSPVLFFLFASCAACGPNTGEDTPFHFERDDHGVTLTEHGKPVFYYRKEPKSLTGEYVCNHYIHPLYALNGDTLTEEFPLDHPYHRGIFWSWHQFYADSISLGDDWIMENISHEVTSLQTGTGKAAATLDLDVLWSSALLENRKDFLMEKNLIRVYPSKKGVRIIDFEVALQALIPGVSMGGSDDEKGYGGFCARLKLPDDLAFTSDHGLVIPQNLQLIAGPWMDFSGTFGPSDEVSGLTICCHPSTPNYPAPWILRQKSSMQNIVFPGRERVELSMERPIVLRYRLLIHEGSAGDLNLDRLQAGFEETHFK